MGMEHSLTRILASDGKNEQKLRHLGTENGRLPLNFLLMNVQQ